jgi:2-polyprenyl-3-methyl-5-hydroxy-6-metoxy-1,4-benzoquinol methylase
MVDIFEKVTLNKNGYYSLKEVPTDKELKEYYEKSYYQNERSSYSREYSQDEIKYFKNKIEQKAIVVEGMLPVEREKLTLLDIGCGEGWALDHFQNRGWNVLGIDYSSYGCREHNPSIVDQVITGNIYEKLDDIIKEKEVFDCLWLDNVLEHVVHPDELLKQLQKLAKENTVLVVEVPNDFSAIQKAAIQNEIIEENFWVVTPDHISYFNSEGLAKLAESVGWACVDIITDFPIDFNLFNQNSNYINDRSKGKGCHFQRVQIENIIHSISPQLANEYYRSLAKLGLGRQITAFFKLK